jgi:hypothetical protein
MLIKEEHASHLQRSKGLERVVGVLLEYSGGWFS